MGSTTHSDLSPLVSIITQENTPQNVPTGQSDGPFLNLDSVFTDDSSLFQVENNNHQPSLLFMTLKTNKQTNTTQQKWSFSFTTWLLWRILELGCDQTANSCLILHLGSPSLPFFFLSRQKAFCCSTVLQLCSRLCDYIRIKSLKM